LAAAEKRGQRTCLGCRRVLDQNQFVRYTLSPQEEVVVDYRQKLPGRGAYTCPDRQCVEQAVKRRQFDRAFRGRNITPSVDSLLEAIAARIRESALGLLAMARKSGNVVTGGHAVLDALGTPSNLALVVLAEDISEGVAGKITAKAKASRVPCFRLADKETLGRQVGKVERSSVGVKSGPLGEKLAGELFRYKNIVGES
jgi:predicted RNA-binding protein YlxR (DUF448 family)/ribosomal protein L30E